MIWINRLPLPPSTNNLYETGARKVLKINKNGKRYEGFKTSRRRSDELVHFQAQMKSFANINYERINLIKIQINNWIEQGFVIRMDSFVAFEYSRVWSLQGKPKQIDSDNRIKSLQDCIADMLGIDDKHIFIVNMEKITCEFKLDEQAIISLEAVKPRTLNDIKKLK